MQAEIARHKEMFLDDLAQRMAQIQTAWSTSQEVGFVGESIESLHRLVHSLESTAGTFELESLVTAATPLKVLLLERVRAQGGPWPQNQAAGHHFDLLMQTGTQMAAVRENVKD